jgi:hypothetical protein
MKTTFLKPVLMVAVFGLAIFSAFAFKTVKPEKTLDVFPGHIEVSPGNCENKEVDCQTINNGKPCLFGVTQLRKMNGSGTDCPTLLWEIEE